MKNQELAIGQFISGKYQYGSVCGVIKKILKNVVVIQVYDRYYNELTPTKLEMNITKSRIFEIGFGEKDFVKQ